MRFSEARSARLLRLLMQYLFVHMHCCALATTLDYGTSKNELHTQIVHKLVKEIFWRIQAIVFPYVVGETSILLVFIVAGYPKLRRPIKISQVK